MKDKSTFIRHLILYRYTYDVNYDHLREYNPLTHRNGLNQIAKRMNATGNSYKADVKEVGADKSSTAITKIYVIQATINKTVNYIYNPEKLMRAFLFFPLGTTLNP